MTTVLSGECSSGNHQNCSKTYVHKESFVLVYCSNSQAYIGTESMGDSNSKVTFFSKDDERIC